MLWRVQLSFRRKLGLAGIFSLTVFIMIIAIVRVAIVYDDDRAQADGAWLYTWSMIEQTVGKCLEKPLFPRSNIHTNMPCDFFSYYCSLPCLVPGPIHSTRSLTANFGREGLIEQQQEDQVICCASIDGDNFECFGIRKQVISALQRRRLIRSESQTFV